MKINLWLGVPKTLINLCFLMVMNHRLKTPVLWHRCTVSDEILSKDREVPDEV